MHLEIWAKSLSRAAPMTPAISPEDAAAAARSAFVRGEGAANPRAGNPGFSGDSNEGLLCPAAFPLGIAMEVAVPPSDEYPF